MDSNLQGRGTYVWADGRRYEGEWVKDEMHGSGVYTWPDGRKYVGEFQKGKKHGWGTLNETAGTYVGEWANGLKHGKGTFTYKEDNRVVKGIWFENVLKEIQEDIDPNAKPDEDAQVPEPSVISEPPSKVEPEPPKPDSPKPVPQQPPPRSLSIPFSDLSEEDRVRVLADFSFPPKTKLTGFASQKAIEKRKEIGPFPFNAMSGNKRPFSEWAELDDQTVYRGEFNEASLRHGRGVCLSKGEIYEGAWEEDKPSGLGRRIDAQGGVLLCFWAVGDPHGFGVLRSSDETVYCGEWVCGEREGLGYEHGDMVIYKGQFQGGFKHGYGRLEMPRVGVYVGMFEKDLREGFGLMTTLEGAKYVGGWREDRKEGKGVMSQKDGLMLTGKFTDDVQSQVVPKRYLKEILDPDRLFILERKSVGANAPTKLPLPRSSSDLGDSPKQAVITPSPPADSKPEEEEEDDQVLQADSPVQSIFQPAPTSPPPENRPKKTSPPKSLFDPPSQKLRDSGPKPNSQAPPQKFEAAKPADSKPADSKPADSKPADSTAKSTSQAAKLFTSLFKK